MKTLFGIEIEDDYFDYLFGQQSLGKDIKPIDGKVVAVEHEITEEELKEQRIAEIKTWFAEYDNQVKQYQRCVRLGLEFDKDIVELDNQAKVYQEELRELKNK